MDNTAVFLLVLVLGIASIMFGVWLFINGIKVWTLISESKQWVKTKGTIIEARLGYKIFHNNEGSYSVKFHLIKKYEYTVEGQSYVSEQRLASEKIHIIFFTPMDKKEKRIKKLARYSKIRYPDKRDELLRLIENFKGDSLDVFYNPRNHHDACLTTRMPFNVYLQFFMSILIFSAGIGLMTLFINFI